MRAARSNNKPNTHFVNFLSALASYFTDDAITGSVFIPLAQYQLDIDAELIWSRLVQKSRNLNDMKTFLLERQRSWRDYGMLLAKNEKYKPEPKKTFLEILKTVVINLARSAFNAIFITTFLCLFLKLIEFFSSKISASGSVRLSDNN